MLTALISARGVPQKKQYILQESVTQQREPFNANANLPDIGLSQRWLKAGELTPPSAHHLCLQGKTLLFDLISSNNCT